MRKKIFVFNILFLSIFFSQNISMPSFAQASPKAETGVYTCYVNSGQSGEATELNVFLAKYLNALNAHDLKKISDFYASNFISGDGFNRDQLTDLIKQSWEKYPDLKYLTTVKNLRFEAGRASVEFSEDITATTKDKSEITKDKGALNGSSGNILYLEKYGSGWKIITDKTLYEETSIKYGTAKNTNIHLDVPEQILSGENYSASLKVDLPADVFALGSVSSVPLVYPVKQPEETFRQIPPDLNLIERVIKSNKTCLNEIVSAAVSFCEAERTAYTGIAMKITGTATVLKRVNVASKR